MDIRRTDDVALRVAVLRLKAQVHDLDSGDPQEHRDHSGVVRLPKLVKAVLTREAAVGAGLATSAGSVQLSGVIQAARQLGALIVPPAGTRPVWRGSSGVAGLALTRVYAPGSAEASGGSIDVRA